MKYLGDLARISLFVVMIYFPMSWWSVRDTLDRIDTAKIAESAARLTSAKNIIDIYLKDGRSVDACQRLAAEFAANTLTAYQLKTSDVECTQRPEFIQAVFKDLPLGKFVSFKINSSNEIAYYRQNSQGAEWGILFNSCIDFLSTNSE